MRAGEETVVWVASTGALHLLNRTATLVLECIADTGDSRTIADSLSMRCDSSLTDVRAEVAQLVDELRQRMILAEEG